MAKEETKPKELKPKAKVEEVGPCKLKITVQITAAKVKERIDQKYKDLSDSVALPGFRKGKAPRNLLERKFGKALLVELKGELLQDSYEEVREEKKLEPVGEPDIDPEKLSVEEGKAFAYDFQIEVQPSFELKSYTGLKVERPAVTIAAEDIDGMVENLRMSKSEFVPAKDAAKVDDQVICDLALSVDGKEIDKAQNNTFFLTDQLAFYGVQLKDLHKEFIGKTPKAEIDHEFEIPGDFEKKDLAGKRANIHALIESVKRQQLPELNEQFAKSFDMDSLEEFREHVETRLRREREAAARTHMAEHLVTQIVEAHDFELPRGLVDSGTEEWLQRMRVQMTMQGAKAEQIEKAMEENKDGSRENMTKSLKTHFILDKIAAKERIFVTEDKVEERIGQMAAQNGNWPHEMKKQLEEQGLMTQLRRQMREDLVREHLLEKSEIIEPSKGKDKVEPT